MTCPQWANDAAEHDEATAGPRLRAVLVDAQKASLTEIPASGDIARWHQRVFRDVVPLTYYAGGFRQFDQNRPCLASDVMVAGVPGAPHSTVLQLMSRFTAMIRERLSELELAWTTLPAPDRTRRLAVTVGTLVGAFIKVHPFLNGNGRTSRMLWSILLHRLGFPFRLSVLRHPPLVEYDTAMAAAMKGDYAPTIALVLDALSQPRTTTGQLPTP